jgi:hypothetical protein
MLLTALIVQPWYVMRSLHLSLANYLRDALARPLLTCSVFLSICYGVAPLSHALSPGIVEFLATLIWQGGIFAVLAFVIGLTPWERQLVSRRCRHLAGIGFSEAKS